MKFSIKFASFRPNVFSPERGLCYSVQTSDSFSHSQFYRRGQSRQLDLGCWPLTDRRNCKLAMNKLPRQIQRNELKPGESLCDHCTAKCCRYFALAIDRPSNARDFGFLRWYLLHEFASLFTEGNDWYLLVHTSCKHLQPDNRCGIYQTRPQICQDYTTDECEYDDNYTFDRYFELPEQVEEYSNARFNHPGNFRSPRPGLTVLN